MRLDDHRHCKSCGKLIDPGEEVCSDACREKRERMRATRQNYTYLMYAMIALLFLFLVLGYVR
jgi:predicted nucleic acid-binding Zn ribbon protein